MATIVSGVEGRPVPPPPPVPPRQPSNLSSHSGSPIHHSQEPSSSSAAPPITVHVTIGGGSPQATPAEPAAPPRPISPLCPTSPLPPPIFRHILRQEKDPQPLSINEPLPKEPPDFLYGNKSPDEIGEFLKNFRPRPALDRPVELQPREGTCARVTRCMKGALPLTAAFALASFGAGVAGSAAAAEWGYRILSWVPAGFSIPATTHFNLKFTIPNVSYETHAKEIAAILALHFGAAALGSVVL